MDKKMEKLKEKYDRVLEEFMEYRKKEKRENYEDGIEEKDIALKIDKDMQTEESNKKLTNEITFNSFFGSCKSGEKMSLNQTGIIVSPNQTGIFASPKPNGRRTNLNKSKEKSNSRTMKKRTGSKPRRPSNTTKDLIKSLRSKRAKSKRDSSLKLNLSKLKPKKIISKSKSKTTMREKNYSFNPPLTARASRKKSISKPKKTSFNQRKRDSSSKSSSSFKIFNKNLRFKKKNIPTPLVNKIPTPVEKIGPKTKNFSRNIYSNLYSKGSLRRKRDILNRNFSNRKGSRSLNKMRESHKVRMKEIVKKSFNENYSKKYDKQNKKNDGIPTRRRNLKNLQNVYQKI